MVSALPFKYLKRFNFAYLEIQEFDTGKHKHEIDYKRAISILKNTIGIEDD